MTQLLNLEIYQFIFVFLRIGSAILLMPGFAVSYVTERQRLTIALAITVVLVPFLSSFLPPAPADFLDFLRLALFEITYGVFMGLFMQALYAALIVLETFLSIIALTVIFITDLHHLMLSAVVDSYRLFPVGLPLPLGDFSDFMSQTVNASFVIGFKIASPFIAFSIVFYVGMGLVSRLMPQLNIFFLSLPLQIYLGLGLLFITTPIMILWFVKYYEGGLMKFVSGS